MRRVAPIATVVVAATFAVSSLPGAAAAAVTVGQACPSTDFMGGLTVAQVDTAFATPSYAMPSDGVLTTADSDGPNALGNSLKIKVFRPTADPAAFTIVGQSDFAPIEPGPNHYAIRISVKKDDLLGMSTTQYSLRCGSVNITDQTRSFGGDPATGAIVSGTLAGNYLVSIAAKLEPDADGDGFGDETQDKCKGANGPADGCPLPPQVGGDKTAPALTVSGGKSQRLGASVRIAVACNEACAVSATGSIKLGKRKKAKVVRAFAIGPARLSLAANANGTAKLPIPKKIRKKVKPGLRAGARAKVSIALVATDAAGNSATKQVTVRLKR